MVRCFAIFLAAFSCTQAESASHYNHNRDDVGFRKETSCSWNCTVTNSDFPLQRKTDFTTHRLIRLVVHYEVKVNEKCVNKASDNSSGNATEYFRVWLPVNNKLSSFAKAVESLSSVIFSSRPEESIEVKAVCSLKPVRSVRTTATIPASHNSVVFHRLVRRDLRDQGVQIENKNNTESHISEQNGWFDHGLKFFGLVFVVAFVYYSPAFLCLFLPTKVTENGVRLIVLEGASPVSFGSFLGNYFHSGFDTFWHKARMLILRLVVLPLPFLPPTIILECILLPRKKELPYFDVFQSFMIYCFVCYVIQALYGTFFSVTHEPKPCLVCRNVKPDLTCKDIIPRRILNHLRMQPLILVNGWRFFLKCLLNYFKLSTIIFPSWKVSIMWICHFPIFIIFLSLLPAVTIISFATMLFIVFIGIFLTSPVAILCNATSMSAKSKSCSLKWLVKSFVHNFVTTPASSS